MKFYGNGAVWHPTKDCVLARFNDGEFETSDVNVIAYFKKLGFKHDEEEVKEASEVTAVVEEVVKPVANKGRPRK